MKPIVGLVVASFASWLAITMFVDRRLSLEILCGMFGPLVSIAATWLLADWVYARRPETLTSLMITAFAAKLIFFGLYVTVMLRVLSLRPVPFIASFTSYFIVFHLIGALHLQHLFRGGMRASR